MWAQNKTQKKKQEFEFESDSEEDLQHAKLKNNRPRYIHFTHAAFGISTYNLHTGFGDRLWTTDDFYSML